MIVRRYDDVKVVACPNGGFYSRRFLTQSDNMGFTMTSTFIPAGRKETWHYKNHHEACFCVGGSGSIEVEGIEVVYTLEPGVMYALDKHDKHTLTSYTDMHLICVFNPPLVGEEIHNEEGSYDV